MVLPLLLTNLLSAKSESKKSYWKDQSLRQPNAVAATSSYLSKITRSMPHLFRIFKPND